MGRPMNPTPTARARLSRAVGIAAALALPVLLAGCGAIASFFAGPQDNFSTWQTTPLPPDPALNELAAGISSCRIDLADGDQLEIVLQDRRTQWTAAFLVKGPTTVGSCYASSSGGGAGGGSMPANQLDALDQPIVVDEDGSGGAGEGALTFLGGRIAPNVVNVIVVVPGVPEFLASVGNGHWLGWWPGSDRATRVFGRGADGRQVFALSWENGWVAE